MAFAIVANAQSRYANHSLLSNGKWVKVRVKDEGVYQLTQADIKKMGFSNLSKVKLYGYNVPILPETNLEYFDDDLTEIPLFRKNDGTALFYSCGTILWTQKKTSSSSPEYAFTHKVNPYSNYIYYLLTEDNASEPLKLEKEESTEPKLAMTTFPEHALVENDEFSFLNAGRTFFESYDFSTGSTKTYTVPMPGIASTDVNVDVQFGAAGSSASSLSIASGENNLATLNFTKLAEYQYGDVRNKNFTWSNVVSEKPTLKFSHTRSTGVSGHLDYIRASYTRKLEIGSENYLIFRTKDTSNYAATIEGGNENTVVLRVTAPQNTVQARSEFANGKIKANIIHSDLSSDTYVAINTNATFAAPEFVCKIENQDLHSLDSIDFVIITPANGKLTKQAQRLAEVHSINDGISCIVVEADKIYNEFSSGTPDATAYRRFVKMLYDKAKDKESAPKNVLLFGNCLWDNRLITSGMRNKSQDDFLLCYESENSVSHTDSYVLEEYFTLLADGKGVSPLKEKPDCGVGRLPVSTEAEARIVVDKLVHYMSNEEAGAWKNTICMMADDGNRNIHMQDAESVISNTESLFPNFRYKKIYWDSFTRETTSTGNTYKAAYDEINKTVEEGALIMNYTGHGAAYCLSHEQVLKTKDFQNWSSPRLPLWLTAACDVAPFDMNTQNLACEAVMNKNGGAIGFIGTARTVYSDPNRTLNKYFMSHVLANKKNGKHYTIGEALAEAKSDIISSKTYFSKTDSINKVHFVLLGDPALKLATPTYKVVIDKMDGKVASSTNMPTIAAGKIVTIEGHIVDDNGNNATNFNGIVSPIVYDSKEKITCKNNAGEDVTPYQFYDRKRMLYSGADSVSNGKFKFTFPVPLDINYSDEQGLISLYAVNVNKEIEAQGKNENFRIGGTEPTERTDTIGPAIIAYLNSLSFKQGEITNETPTLYITLQDSSGINTTGNGLGHDIQAIIDNNEATTYTLNNFYTQEVGDFRKGTIVYDLPQLPAGKHIMTLRAFDTLNNMGEATIYFEVVEGMKAVVEIYDLSGRKMLNSDRGKSLPKGVYIRNIRMEAPSGTVSKKSEKFIVTQ
ncbi:MAG: type IX secretion system sortase PorU [Prevotellaceae bacterium]|nr:type IX secretion system sortase PorU [Candidatus Minthosoma caballi]